MRPRCGIRFRQGVDALDDTVVVLMLGRPADVERLDPPTARALAGWERPRVLAISPWSLDCVERVARVLRTWEAPMRANAYPPRAKVRPDPGVPLPTWLVRADAAGDFVAVVAPAPSHERRAFAQACDKQEAALRREQSAAQRAQRPFDPGRMTAIAALRDLAVRAGELELWKVCPVCGNAEGNDYDARPGNDERWDRWTWWCCCRSCSSSWGTWICGSCQCSFPVLLPHGRQGPQGDGISLPGWLDRACGRDMWAEPCWRPGSGDTFRCTWCKTCPSGGCSRCSAHP